MSWRDSLTWADATDQLKKKASFRGATFFIRSSDASVGRRNVTHQYPFRDEVYIEDLGLDVDEFSITGYVVQNLDNDYDYFAERDALIAALKESGPGQLWHPFLGSKLVSLVGKAGISESFGEGGIARFTMTFALVGKGLEAIPYPIPTIDNVKAVDAAAENSQNDMIDGYGEKFNAEDAPGFSVASIMTAVGSLNGMLRSATVAVKGLGPAMMSKALTHLADAYAGINLATIGQTCELANGLIGMFNGLLSLSGMYGDIIVNQLFGACSSAVRGISSGPMSGAKVEKTPTAGFQASTMAEPATIDESMGKSAVRAALAMNRYGEDAGNDNPSPYGGTLESVSITTSVRATQSANLVATVNLARLMAITTAARTAVRINYSSYDSAIEILNEVVEQLDVLLLKLGDDAANTEYASYNVTVADPDSYNALVSLRPVFVEAMTDIGANLARIVDYEVPPATESTLALAYNQYENLDREAEIIGRNIPLVKNPGFLPQGQEIEILNV